MHSNRPILIIIFGLPGTGKTTFAILLSKQLGIKHFNTDIIRSLSGKSQQYNEENKELIYNKVPEEIISIQDFGEFNPIYDNSTYQGRIRNRRVDIILWPLNTL